MRRNGCGDGVSCELEVDTSFGEVELAGAYLQFRERHDLIAPFLESIGEPARVDGYMKVLSRMPKG